MLIALTNVLVAILGAILTDGQSLTVITNPLMLMVYVFVWRSVIPEVLLLVTQGLYLYFATSMTQITSPGYLLHAPKPGDQSIQDKPRSEGLKNVLSNDKEAALVDGGSDSQDSVRQNDLDSVYGSEGSLGQENEKSLPAESNISEETTKTGERVEEHGTSRMTASATSFIEVRRVSSCSAA